MGEERRVKLQFMVDPEELKRKAYVENPVRLKIIEPEAIFLLGILGESGRALVQEGICFIFEKQLADILVQKGIAQIVEE